MPTVLISNYSAVGSNSSKHNNDVAAEQADSQTAIICLMPMLVCEHLQTQQSVLTFTITWVVKFVYMQISCKAAILWLFYGAVLSMGV